MKKLKWYLYFENFTEKSFFFFSNFMIIDHDIIEIKSSCCIVYKKVSYKLLNPIALRKAKIVFNFGLSECNRVKVRNFTAFRRFR